MKKNPSLSPANNLKGQKARPLEHMLGPKIMLPIGCTKFLFPKEFFTIFGLGYTHPVQRTPYLLQKTQSTFPSLM
jgi:hypothetical protein